MRFCFRPGHEQSDAREGQDKEYEAGRKAKVEVEKTKGVRLKGFEDAPALRYRDQATFHPLKYLERPRRSDRRGWREDICAESGDGNRRDRERGARHD